MLVVAFTLLFGVLFAQDRLGVELPDSLQKEVVRSKNLPQKEKEVAKQVVEREEFRMVVANIGDPMRSLVTLPGVSMANDLSVRPWIRGGDERETRIFWNGIPLIQPYHMTSFFSVFPIETIEKMELYTSGFPADAQGSLSGVVAMQPRRPSLDSLEGNLDLTLMRGGIYTSYPLIKEKLAIYGFYQELLYSKVYDGVLGLVSLMGNDNTANDIDEFRSLVELPNFRDVGFGVFYRPAPGLQIGYNLLWANDFFHVVEPEYYDEFNGELFGKDTAAWVDVNNIVNAVDVQKNLNSLWTLKLSAAWQSNNWDVDFGSDDYLNMDLEESSGHLKSTFFYDGWKGHQFSMGWTGDYIHQKYHLNMLRPLFQLIRTGDFATNSILSLFGPEGFEEREDTESGVERYAEQIEHKERGERDQFLNGLFVSDAFALENGAQLQWGLRLEHETQGNDFFPSPRVQYVVPYQKDMLFTVGAGWYSQNQYPFEYRHYNPKLSSEKAIHVNGEWTWDFAKGWKFEISNYYKFYHDLVYGALVQSEDLDWDKLSENFYWEIAVLRGTEELSFLEQSGGEYFDLANEEFLRQNWDLLTKEEQAFLTDQYGTYRLNYENGGIGHALGTEWTLHYKPNQIWRGRIGVETSLSLRKDGNSEVWYPFENHRFWIVRWMNHFQFGENYTMGIRQLFSSGKAYTPWWEYDEGPVRFKVGRRNSARYNNYYRADLSLSHRSTLFGFPFETYTEVWNLFFNPNFFLRDSETDEVKGGDMSLPVPVFFAGVRMQF